jgi:hypothetical protein
MSHKSSRVAGRLALTSALGICAAVATIPWWPRAMTFSLGASLPADSA